MDTLQLMPSASFSPPAELDIGVFAWIDTSYSLVASVQQGVCSGPQDMCGGHAHDHAMLLQEGRPLPGSLALAGYSYFDLEAGDSAVDLQVLVTPFVGQPALYASLTSLWPTSSSHDLSEAADLRGVISASGSSASLQTCRHRTGPNSVSCVLHVAVYCPGSCSFSVLGRARSTQAIATVLVDGRPQRASLRPHEWGYFSLQVGNTR